MTPTAPCRDKRPLLTKPTTMTVVALDDWMTAVTSMPRKKPLSGLSVRRASNCCRRPPACFSSALPITSIPNKNSAKPPSRENTAKISMQILSSQCEP